MKTAYTYNLQIPPTVQGRIRTETALYQFLGEDFRAAVHQTLAKLKKNPYQFKIAKNNYLWAPVKDFPYQIRFEIWDKTIIVVGLETVAT